MRLLFIAALIGACEPGVPRACNNTAAGDVVDGCGVAPDAGAVPGGSVGPEGGSVERLWFATTGDTRPSQCDATDQYPKAAIAQIAAAMKALRVQFTVDLGDHMYVCNHSDAEAAQQMGFYMDAVAQGP